MSVLAFVVNVDPGDSELAADLLWDWGVVAVEERQTTDGRVELWTALGEDHERISSLTAQLREGWAWRLVEVDTAVADSWRDFAEPVVINDRLIVAPAWCGVVDAADTQCVIRIEPGPTFGLGDHPTTVSTLRAMLAELAIRPVDSLLDIGCGSGVLAVAACALGVERAVAIDISPASPEVTTANAEANGVAGRIDVSCRPLADIESEFPLVVANILAPALIELSPDIVRVVAAGGTLILSGLLDGRFDHVVAAMTGFEVVAVERLDGWVALTLRR